MPKKRNANGDETLRGLVTAVEWQLDEVTAVALSATDDEEYRIENGDQFIDLAQSYIEVTGSVNRHEKPFKSIRIKRYKVLESF